MFSIVVNNNENNIKQYLPTEDCSTTMDGTTNACVLFRTKMSNKTVFEIV